MRVAAVVGSESDWIPAEHRG